GTVPRTGQAPPPPPSQTQEAPATQAVERTVDEVAAEVEHLRGWTFKRPVARVRTTVEQAKEDIRRNLEKALPRDRRALNTAFLSTAGFVPADLDVEATLLTLLEQQVAGYYQPETATLHLVQRANKVPEFVERIVLVHELTHALDDQHADIRTLTEQEEPRTADMDIVVTAVVEGSATSLMLQHMVRAQAAGRVNPAELMAYAAEEMERAKVFESLPRYFSAMFGSYLVGAGFLAQGEVGAILKMPDNRVIGERFLAARRALPLSSEQLLHPEKYWDPLRRDDPSVIDDAAVERWLAGANRWVVHRDTIGELLTAVLTTPRTAKMTMAQLQSLAAWTNGAAAGWDGDRFFLLASGADAAEAARTLNGVRGVWLTTWDSGKDRDEFQAALAEAAVPAGTTVVPLGATEAVVFFGVADAEREALVRELPKEGAGFVRQ
ncbi:MAG TPA: hypothetical protein VK911_04545, partial [Vicinamibacterales bacterium]|nr:hypothetical protein [Vicinamibacterales bacterium]